MRQINDYEEKVMTISYLTRNNKEMSNEEEIERMWCAKWKEDAECFEDGKLIKDICMHIADVQMPTKEFGRRKTLDFLKNELFVYRDDCCKKLNDLAHTVGWDIQCQTSKKHPSHLGRYRIKKTDHVGTYDEIRTVIMSKKARGNQNEGNNY